MPKKKASKKRPIKVTKHAVSFKEHRAKVRYEPVEVELSPLEIEHAPYERPEPIVEPPGYHDANTPTEKPGFWKRLGAWLNVKS